MEKHNGTKSTADKSFFGEALAILKEEGRALALLWYHFGCGSKDFFLLRNEQDLMDLTGLMNPSDELTIFKKTGILREETLRPESVGRIVSAFMESAGKTWLVIWETGNLEVGESALFDKTEAGELEMSLKATIGQKVSIFLEPDWTEEGEFIRAYSPCLDGFASKGKY